MKDLIYVIGLSKFGASVASILSSNGKDVVAIDLDEKSFSKLDENYGGMKITGDALDLSFLEENEIMKADKVVIAVRDDNANIFLANLCDIIFKIPKIYVRLNRKDQEGILNSKNIKPIYPFRLSLDYFLNMLGEKNENSNC